MKNHLQNGIFVLSISLGGLVLKTYIAQSVLHNNINRINARPVLQIAFLMRFFYCAVVIGCTASSYPKLRSKIIRQTFWRIINSAGSKVQTFNQRPSWRKLIDTDCQPNTVECLQGVEENECLHWLNGLTIKANKSLSWMHEGI